jgi:hypothetical protein
MGKRMKNLFLSFCLLVMSSIVLAQEKDVIMKGEAFDKDNKLVYVETHHQKRLPTGEVTSVQTKYHNPTGKLIAEVSVNFSKDLFTPDTVFIDYRFNEKKELIYNVASKKISMKITNLTSGEVKNSEIERTDNMFTRQGFHNYILKHFNETQLDVKFIVLSKLDYYSFYLEQAPPMAEGQRRFILKISNWVLKAVIKEITVDYRIKDHALLTYEGITNIQTDNGDSQMLKIKMSYPGVDNDKKNL